MILTRILRCCLVVALAGRALMPDPASGQKRGGPLVMLVQPEPPTLASYLSTSGPIGQVTTKVYEGLLEYDFNLKPLPGLALMPDTASGQKRGGTLVMLVQPEPPPLASYLSTPGRIGAAPPQAHWG